MHSKGTQLYIYMYPLSPKLPSHPGYHITLSRVPCAIQYNRPFLVIHRNFLSRQTGFVEGDMGLYVYVLYLGCNCIVDRWVVSGRARVQ